MRHRLLWIDPDRVRLNRDLEDDPAFEVTIVETGADARIALSSMCFDAVILELVLPDEPSARPAQSGVRLLEDLRQGDEFATNGPKTPVIVYTMVADSNIVRRIQELGAVYHGKPVFTDVLVADLESLIAAAIT